jgi:hypothetical protein
MRAPLCRWLVSALAALVWAGPAAAVQECVCLSKPVLPVALSVYRSSAAWRLSFRIPPCVVIAEYFVRIDGEKERSAGFEEEIDPVIGRPRVRDWVMVSDVDLLPGEHTVTVRMVRRDGKVDGPYKLRFSPEEELLADGKTRLEMLRSSFIEFAEYQEEYTILMFSVLFGMRETVREIHYSVDDCSLRERVRLDAPADAKNPAALTAARPFLLLPESTRSTCAQAVFRDSTLSRVLQLRPQAAPLTLPAAAPAARLASHLADGAWFEDGEHCEPIGDQREQIRPRVSTGVHRVP